MNEIHLLSITDGEIVEFKKESRWAVLELNYLNGQWTIVRHKDEISE